jgi:hypothetical protein
MDLQVSPALFHDLKPSLIRQLSSLIYYRFLLASRTPDGQRLTWVIKVSLEKQAQARQLATSQGRRNRLLPTFGLPRLNLLLEP